MGCGSTNKNTHVTVPSNSPAFVIIRGTSHTSIDPFEEHKRAHVLGNDLNAISANICPTCQISFREIPEHQRTRHLLVHQTQEMLSQLNNFHAIR
jgi:hypothetical protein